MAALSDTLDLDTNELSGDTPTSICQLAALTFLDLSANHLNGATPACIGD